MKVRIVKEIAGYIVRPISGHLEQSVPHPRHGLHFKFRVDALAWCKANGWEVVYA